MSRSQEPGMTERVPRRAFRSRDWFANTDRVDMTGLYLERFMNYGVTPEELREGKPIIGIAQSGSDLSPCNRVHIELAKRVRDGIRDAGGIPMEFPVHPIFENCRRPTAALDRNLAYLGLVEILNGYPIDAVVLTTGCDKTTPSQIMAAATMNLPAIVLSGGPMLDGWWNNQMVGSGTVVWQSRRRLAAGEIDNEQFIEACAGSAPSVGHCNTMGTASTMNAVAEALGMSLTGCAAIPAPYRERGQMAYYTGRRIVEMAYDDLRPLQILTREAFLDAIAVVAVVGGSTNAQPHITAMARHAGVEISTEDWRAFSHAQPLLVDMAPAGRFLGERFHRAGGVPAAMWEMLEAGRLHPDRPTVTGKTMRENLQGRQTTDREMIYTYDRPLRQDAGFIVMKGNFFDFALMKASVLSEAFEARLQRPNGGLGVFEGKIVIFEGGEDYHDRINSPDLGIGENTILVMRGAGPIGWPGSAEVVNMQPPDALIQRGVMSLPTLGDGRQSGTSDSPSILHVTPESAVGGDLAFLKDGDRLRIDLDAGRVDLMISDEEMVRRRAQLAPAPTPESQTPWEEIFRSNVGSIETGAVLESAVKYQDVSSRLPRHNH
jgi:dihydroxy-acid dehydratase